MDCGEGIAWRVFSIKCPNYPTENPVDIDQIYRHSLKIPLEKR